MGMAVEQSNDQPLGKPGFFGGVHGISNGLVENTYRSVDVLPHGKHMPQASDVAHQLNGSAGLAIERTNHMKPCCKLVFANASRRGSTPSIWPIYLNNSPVSASSALMEFMPSISD